MKKLEVGKTYKYTDGTRYIRVLKHLQKYESFLCDSICKGDNVTIAYRTAVEYDEIFLWSETEEDFDEILSTIPERDRSHALRLNK